MRIKNDQAGLTLVELLVTIVVASIVTLAACTMLLFGLRINNQSTKTSMGQNTVQVLMEALEDVAAEAKNLEIISDLERWEIKGTVGEETKTFFAYVAKDQIIYSGPAPIMVEAVGTPFLTGIYASTIKYENQLLTIDVQTELDNYSTSIYCRMGTKSVSQGDPMAELLIDYLKGGEKPTGVSLPDEKTIRFEFLKTLASQDGSRGRVNNTGDYYAVWYKGVKKLNGDGWDGSTPWCACYVSWALVNTSGVNDPPIEANVETLRNAIAGANKLQSTTKPTPGDLVFFNFDEDAQSDHVGVVLLIHEGYFYTIEGNTAGKVAVRKYSANYDTREVDPRIIEYGKILG